MAKQAIDGHPPFERGFKGIDIVYTLAGIGPFAKQVLIDVRDSGGIRVDTKRARKHAQEYRALLIGWQGGRDPWLEDRIAFDYALACRIQPWLVQGVSHLADEASDGFAGQFCVGIERDHIANAHGYVLGIEKTRVGGASQKPV